MAEIVIRETRGAAPDDARAVREKVFVVEQEVSRDEEWDAHDAAGSDTLHFVATVGASALGCARLRAHEGRAKVERVAVLRERREGGVGRRLMAAVEAAAVREGYREGLLNAQTAVIPFYERLGWRAEGPVFQEANIPHRRMTKTLAP